MEPGGRLLVYSDALTEAQDRNGDFFGEERLLELVPQLTGLSAEAAGRGSWPRWSLSQADLRQSDDLPLVLARRAG